MAELKKDGIRAVMSEAAERETLKRMSQGTNPSSKEVEPEIKAPDHVWVKLLSTGDLAAYRRDIRAEHFDGRPVFEYTRVPLASTAPVVDCTCLASGNQVAWEYVHHTNDCPVYVAGEAAKRWLLEHPNLKHSRIFAGAAAWDRETVATLLVQYATRFTSSPAVPRDEAAGDVVLIDREEAARVICSYCASYGLPEKDTNLGWIHRGKEFSVNCEAYAIRSLAPFS